MPDEQTSQDLPAVLLDAPPVLAPTYTSVEDLIKQVPTFQDDVRTYYARLRSEYTQRVAEIDSFLGFLEMQGELGTRLERVERFVGIVK
jgi:hypothetical protein